MWVGVRHIRLYSPPCDCLWTRWLPASLSRWPGEGIVPITRKNDTAGPLGVRVADVALLDSVVMSETMMQISSASSVLNGLSIAIPTDWINQAEAKGKLVAASYAEGLEKAAAALERAGATVVRDSRDFYQSVVSIRDALAGGHPKSFCHADLQWYLDQHKDRPQTIQTAAQMHEKMVNAKIFYETPENPLELAALYEKLDTDAVAQEAAYVAWLDMVGARALLVPPTTCEPISNEEWSKEQMPTVPFSAIAWFTAHLNSIHIPSITLPVRSVRCKQVGCEMLPANVMLLGRPNEDRELLALALALEQALDEQ